MEHRSDENRIRVLGIAGSPRRGGNTEMLLDHFLEGAEGAGAQVEKVPLTQWKIANCAGCGECEGDGVCAIRDDFQALEEKIIACDVIALAAPLYFWHVPAQVKGMIDRGQHQWVRKFIHEAPLPATSTGRDRRRGVFLSTGGGPQGYFEGAVRTVKAFFHIYETDYWGEVLYSDVDAKGAIEEYPPRLEEARRLGERAASWG